VITRFYAQTRLFELRTEALKAVSLPGHTVLGEHGENLASVLFAVSDDARKKADILSWLQELTPSDIHDFTFLEGADGKIALQLVEHSGRKVSAFSASDGTLRFLGLLAALLGPTPPPFIFLEEIETGLHPSRLHLLVQLLEQVAEQGKTQIVATTHSPLVLHHLSPTSFENAAFTYRLPDEAETHVSRIVDVPDARRVFSEYDPAELHAAGWLETAVYMLADPELPHTEPTLSGAPA
jgi:predicted ATPase